MWQLNHRKEQAMKKIEKMTDEEMNQEVRDLVDRIIALQRQFSFVPGYRDKATAQECLGLTLSHYFEWGGQDIMQVAYEGLTDANFHTEASVIELLLDAED